MFNCYLICYFIYLVLLAPYGLNAHLTGHSLADTDTRSIKILEEWKKFFPVSAMNAKVGSKVECCASVVEVLFGEVKMLYPASLVLVPIMSKGLIIIIF